MYKAVLFDFDGTLVNDLSLFVKSYVFALKKFDIHIPEKEIPKICFHKTEEEIATNLNIPSTEQFSKYFFQGVDEIINNVPLFKGSLSLLKDLQKRHIKLGVVTLAKRWYIEKMIDQTRLSKYFQSIISFDDVKKAKPDPEAILLSCKRLKVKLENTLLIGDARGDILMGKAAGCSTALFLPDSNKNFCDFDTLKNLKPDYIFYNYNELKNIAL